MCRKPPNYFPECLYRFAFLLGNRKVPVARHPCQHLCCLFFAFACLVLVILEDNWFSLECKGMDMILCSFFSFKFFNLLSLLFFLRKSSILLFLFTDFICIDCRINTSLNTIPGLFLHICSMYNSTLLLALLLVLDRWAYGQSLGDSDKNQ